jgi:hypothetical protein
METMSLLILAAIGEAVWETLKMIWQDDKKCVDKIGAVIIGLVLAVGSGTDLMKIVGVPMQIPYVGMILTGILISRGSNFVHDILASLSNYHQKTK